MEAQDDRPGPMQIVGFGIRGTRQPDMQVEHQGTCCMYVHGTGVCFSMGEMLKDHMKPKIDGVIVLMCISQ